MSTKKRTVKVAAGSRKTASAPKDNTIVFTKENWMWVIIGVAVIAIGFILMSGGRSDDPNVFPADEIYSFRRITLAPIVVLLGFAIEVYAIFKKPKATATGQA